MTGIFSPTYSPALPKTAARHEGFPADGRADAVNPDTPGDSWNDGVTKVLQVGYSQGYFPDTANGYYGFRLVRRGE